MRELIKMLNCQLRKISMDKSFKFSIDKNFSWYKSQLMKTSIDENYQWIKCHIDENCQIHEKVKLMKCQIYENVYK